MGQRTFPRHHHTLPPKKLESRSTRPPLARAGALVGGVVLSFGGGFTAAARSLNERLTIKPHSLSGLTVIILRT